ncbi:8-amino-7-oxononanoate synthase [Capilliphycus salinus ALCB114379]|uniref:8-amino-7-oxononanoate synthase n=1 Tax=Capilliphycus salinus TaxID=2768948 RepID=UPI0039A4C606
MSINAYTWIERSLKTIHRADWYRSVQTVESLPGPTITLDGRELINFASNDYLGLAGEQRLINAAIAATEKFGTGTTGSRLLTGHRHLHRELELAIARLKQTEDAIVFSSGYLANLGTIAALVGRRDLILSDRYNHSSLKNGAKVSGATILEYYHNDTEELRQLLQQHRHQYRKSLIITDSVFSMDGDLCSLPELLELAAEFNCMLIIDEAHATGILGKTGAGCVEYFGCTGQPLIQMGTLSKALGSLGGYVAGSATLIDYLRNRSPSWIYTTGLSPADTAAALEAVKIIQKEPQRRTQLWHNINRLKQLLQEQPGKTTNTEDFIESWSSFHSPIFCVHLPNATTALNVGQQLKAQGIFAPAIRPPTVSTSRIRISLMATHQLEHLQKLVEVLFSILTKEEVC